MLVSELLETNFGHSAPIGRVRRVDQRLPGKVQLLIVPFTDVTAAAYFVSNAKEQLRGSSDTYTRQTVSINLDLSKVETQAAYEKRVNRRLLWSAHGSTRGRTYI